MKNIISIRDFSKNDIESLIDFAFKRKRKEDTTTFDGKIASLFFEPSTRTRLTFETAGHNLGFYVNGFAGSEGTSVKKGEPLIDTVRMLEGQNYQAIVMRHNLEGAARLAADYLKIPVINAGDSSNQHPSQTLLDLMTIVEKHGKIDGLNIAMVGDLKYGRTVHSLLQALELYDVNITLVAPEMLKMPEWRVFDYENNTDKNINFTDNLQEAIDNSDVLYMTRVQRERFLKGAEGELEYKKVSSLYNLNADMLKSAKEDMIVLHPLPRYKHNLEVGMDVDATKHAWYFKQAANGVPMREAILMTVLGKGFEGKSHILRSEDIWSDLEIINGAAKNYNQDSHTLRNGTLIDHIEQKKGALVQTVLGLDNYYETVEFLVKNLNSSRYGNKAIIGVEDKELSNKELSKVGLFSNTATINIIRDGAVYRKGNVILPSELTDLVVCQNDKCISTPENHEHAPHKFYVESQEPLNLRCHYCEQTIGREQIVLK